MNHDALILLLILAATGAYALSWGRAQESAGAPPQMTPTVIIEAPPGEQYRGAPSAVATPTMMNPVGGLACYDGTYDPTTNVIRCRR